MGCGMTASTEDTMASNQFDALARDLSQTRSRRHVVAVLGSGLVAAVVGTRWSAAAAQGNAAAAKACQQGGYATKVRGEGPRQGQGFQTVGECVSYVAQGGTLASPTLGSSRCDVVGTYNPSTRLPSFLDLDLSSCDMGGLNLTGADLSGADLSDADLSGANLNYANLNAAELSGADLNGASLVRADLAFADLTGATLTGAVLDEALWRNTTCPDGTNSDANGGTCLGHV